MFLLIEFQGSSEPEVIGAGGNVDYVWDDSNLPHKLVIQISGTYFSFSMFVYLYH